MCGSRVDHQFWELGYVSSSLTTPTIFMKTCGYCKNSKALTLFYRRGKTGHQAWCKECSNSNRKAVYTNNFPREQHRKKTLRAKYSKENMTNIFRYLSEQGCKDCGEKDPIVLEFDHKQDKKYNISDRVRRAVWATLQKEIEKCEVRCANCHRRKTAIDRNWYSYMKGTVAQ